MNKLFFVTIFCFSSTYGAQGMTTQLEREKDAIHFKGLLGTFHSKITNAVKLLKIAKSDLNKAQGLLLPGANIILLHGPCGNGKTTLAKKISDAAGAKFFEISGPSILDRYIGGGEEKIQNLFALAKEAVSDDENSCVAVILIDEIDSITAKASREDESHEYSCLRQALQIELDHIKDNPRILFIGTTNNFQTFDKPLRDRFYPIEIKNPDEFLRLQVLEYYWGKYLSCYSCNRAVLKKIAQQSDGLSIRALEQLIVSLASEALTNDLETISEKTIWKEFEASKTKTSGTFIGRSKENISKVSTSLQTHLYPHISALGSVATTIVAFFQIKSVFSPRQVQSDSNKTPNEPSQKIDLSQVTIDTSFQSATAA